MRKPIADSRTSIDWRIVVVSRASGEVLQQITAP